MSEDMPEDMPDHMPEDMPDRMPNRMSEDMSDRMPEDLPVRKCINVMVGITRSKVIFRIEITSQVIPPKNLRCLLRCSQRLRPGGLRSEAASSVQRPAPQSGCVWGMQAFFASFL